ncbi:MAG: RIP metalloprotease RseP, partial [Hydrogenovibrio crunogenus]|nr:RIP metalloprotease RseP [Hydrogenovibrio crunogenus]
MALLWSILGFIIAMGLLVTIHEWGHYIVARLFNIKVTHFSIGFGKPIYVKQKGETQFQIGSIPLGGYVKFADEREGNVAQEDLARAFNRQNVYRRFAVVSAGPLVNLVFAWIAFSLIYFSGVTGLKPVFEEVSPHSVLSKSLPDNHQAWQVESVNGKAVLDWKNVYQNVLQALVNNRQSIEVKLVSLDTQVSKTVFLPLSELDINTPKQKWLSVLGFKPKYPEMPAVIDQVLSDSPAERLGLEKGDLILQIDRLPVENWNQFVAYVQKHPNVTVQLSSNRKDVLCQKDMRRDEKTFNVERVV